MPTCATLNLRQVSWSTPGLSAPFQAMKDRGFDRPFLGVGQESNGDWWIKTCSKDNEAAFVSAFRRVAGLAKAIMSTCVICYDVSNTRPIAGAAYPGAAYVDAIILDYYYRGSGVGDSNGIAEMKSHPYCLRYA